jgi:putative transposase
MNALPEHEAPLHAPQRDRDHAKQSQPQPTDSSPRRIRRLHHVWPDRDGNISYLLTLCVGGRRSVLDNEMTFVRFTSFLLDSPPQYGWFGRRFVILPDHLHLIARQGTNAVRLGEWVKALKAVVGGLQRRDVSPTKEQLMQFKRVARSWRWQEGYHDHKFRSRESESRKWEYVCLNPVRYGLVRRPEEWPFGGEVFYEESAAPLLIRGTPPLLESGILIEGNPAPPVDTFKSCSPTRRLS